MLFDGQSRGVRDLDGDGDLDLIGRLMGQQVAEAVWEQTQQLFSV